MSGSEGNGRYGGDFEDEDDGDEELRTVNDNLIFLINARASMFQENNKGVSHIIDALAFALDVMKRFIVRNPKDSVGIVLYGTENKYPVVGGADNVYVLQKLEPVSGKAMSKLREFVEFNQDSLTEKIGEPLAETGTNSQNRLKEALWTASRQIITKRRQNRYDMRRVWLFTDDDDPCSDMGGEIGRAHV